MEDDESYHSSPESGLPSLWWHEDDCFCVVQWTSESVAIGRMDDAQMTIGTRDPGTSGGGTFPLAILHDYSHAPFSQVWGNKIVQCQDAESRVKVGIWDFRVIGRKSRNCSGGRKLSGTRARKPSCHCSSGF